MVVYWNYSEWFLKYCLYICHFFNFCLLFSTFFSIISLFLFEKKIRCQIMFNAETATANHFLDYAYLIVKNLPHFWCLLKYKYCIWMKSDNFILPYCKRWEVVNTKGIIYALYRVTLQIVKWNVDDIYFPNMSLNAAVQIVSWIVR